MTTEELLRPRVKVIASYPKCGYKIGQILYVDDIGIAWVKNEYGFYTDPVYDVGKYSHLFEPLPWWKDRKVEDMPRFVKHLKSGVFKVKEHCVTGCKIEGGYWSVYDNLLPATEADYNAYRQTTNQLNNGQ